jgi:Ca2+-binding EF-hand superfamily protein
LEANFYNNEKYLARVFEYFDINKDGTLCSNEFKEILVCTGLKMMESADIDEIIKDADLNKDGCIDYIEFLGNMRSRGEKETEIR